MIEALQGDYQKRPSRAILKEIVRILVVEDRQGNPIQRIRRFVARVDALPPELGGKK